MFIVTVITDCISPDKNKKKNVVSPDIVIRASFSEDFLITFYFFSE